MFMERLAGYAWNGWPDAVECAVERTFAWIFKNRRLVRDYEQLTEVAETLITIAASAALIRRWP